MSKYWLLSFVVLLFWGCTPTTSSDTAEIRKSPATYYKRLEGTLDGKSVVFHVNRTVNNWDGVFVADGATHSLLFDSLKADTIIFWDTQANDYYQGRDTQPVIQLVWNGNGFDGRYTKPGKETEKFLLKENYPDGAEKLTITSTIDSLSAFPKKKDSPKSTFSVNHLTAANKWLDARLQLALGIEQNSVTWNDGLRLMKKDYFKGYQAEIAEQLTIQPDSNSGSFNRYNNTDMRVQYNDNGFMVVDVFRSDYTGGAHGSYSSTMLTLDVKNQQVLKLSDIVVTDSVTMQKMVDKYFRKQYGVKPKEKLTKVLFDNFLKPSANFYFNRNGLSFIYNPYEVASYAQGQVKVFIPVAALKPYLVAAFAERMGW